MTPEEVIQRTNEVLHDSFEIEEDQLLPEKHLFQDLGLDSLDTVDLVVALQKKFGVQIRNDDRIMSVRTLGDLHALILTLMREMQTRTADDARS